MLGSSPTQSKTSSGPLVSGTLSFVPYFDNIVKRYKLAVATAIAQVTKEEQEALRQEALAEGSGWNRFATNLNVSFDEEDRELKYGLNAAGNDLMQAQALEFGSEATAPNPLLRKRAFRNKQDFNQRVMQKVHLLLSGGIKVK